MLFKHALLKLAKMGASDNSSPMAEWADNMDMATMVQNMPQLVKSWRDAESQKIWGRFQKEQDSLPKNPMKDVIDFLNLYGRSAPRRNDRENFGPSIH